MAAPFTRSLMAAAVLFGSATAAARMDRGAGFAPFGRPVSTDFAAQDMGAVVSGARRIGADLAFLQTLQYYSTPGPDGEGEQGAHPRLLEYGRRMASLNPHFHYGILYLAGVLGFNNGTERPEEALALLALGAANDPSYWRFRLYAGAIAYRKSAEMDKAVALLEEAATHPDCPSMVKNVLAIMHKKMGNPRRAAEIYADMIRNSRDAEYRSTAERGLQELRAKGLVP